jgi:FkbM family methyltransferase
VAEGSDVTLHGALSRLLRLKLGLQSCVSIGAGAGSDTMYAARKLYPEMAILMVEAQQAHEAELTKLASSDRRIQYAICAASSEDGVVTFDASSLTGGALTAAHRPGTVTLPSRRIDGLVAERGLSGPFFLKFDTHGAELQILAGAAKTLRETALIMMEVYNFKLNFTGGKNLTFDEMCIHLRTIGFRMVDLCLPLHRPGDGVFWQAHFFFVRSTHRVFQSSSYRAPSL